MKWLDRLNAAVLAHIARGRTPTSVDARGALLGETRLSYEELERAVAYCQPNLVGEDMVVLMDFGDERLVAISEHDAAWAHVTRALNVHPRSRIGYAEWSVRLVADPTAQLELLSDR